MEDAAQEAAALRGSIRSSFYGHLTALVQGNDRGECLCSFLSELSVPERFGFVVGRSADLFWAWRCAPNGDARLLRSLALSFASQTEILRSTSSQSVYQSANVHGTVEALARLGVTGLEPEVPAPRPPNKPAADWMANAEWCVQAQPIAMQRREATLGNNARLDEVTKLGSAVYLSEGNFEAAARLLVWRTIHCGADDFFLQAADFIRRSTDSQEATYFLLIAQHAPALWLGQAS